MDRVEDQNAEEFNFINEVGRKAVHLSVWAIPFAYHWILPVLGFSSDDSLLIIRLSLAGFLCIFFPIEFYRIRINPNSWIQVYIYKFITRASEKEGPANYILTTTVWLIVLLGVNLFYSMEVAELVLVTTVMGDSAAALVGKGLGSTKLPFTEQKTVEGFIAGIVTNYVIGFVFLSIVGVPPFLLPIIPTVVWSCFDFFEDLPWYLADNLFGPPIAVVIIAILEQLLV
ncbi:MAG: phosphatidate cytidylyltransferase [Candidatus Heimdallarchaeota archaeon]|nr:MAG: phosphatidate cytidylyltransferase [Candidatus Heimdallarchaeota archaeon]